MVSGIIQKSKAGEIPDAKAWIIIHIQVGHFFPSYIGLIVVVVLEVHKID